MPRSRSPPASDRLSHGGSRNARQSRVSEVIAKRALIPVARPSMGEAEAAAARRAILSGWVTQGPEVAAFEKEFAAYVGAPHAVAVANCTLALELSLRALGVGPGADVI